MMTVFRRELGAYFRSPIGYVFLSIFYAFAGFYFSRTSLIIPLGDGRMASLADLSGVFGNLFMIVLFVIPIVTMRLFAEDKKYKTDQALLTAPISLTSIVLGKYLSAVIMFVLAISITLVFGLVITFFTPPNWGHILGNYLAMLLLGMALTAICMFVSSLTESQVIAATGGFAISLGLVMIDSLASRVTNPTLAKLVESLSFQRHYSAFQDGIFRWANIIFFLGITAAFVFLTIRGLERKRWA